MTDLIFPRALAVAAKAFANKPEVVGGVLVALCGEPTGNGHGAVAVSPRGPVTTGLTEVQKYILGECREELEELAAKRRYAAERQRESRQRRAK